MGLPQGTRSRCGIEDAPHAIAVCLLAGAHEGRVTADAQVPGSRFVSVAGAVADKSAHVSNRTAHPAARSGERQFQGGRKGAVGVGRRPCGQLCFPFGFRGKAETAGAGIVGAADPLPAGFLNWIPALIKIDEATILQTSGVDAVMYIRFFSMCLRLFASASVYGRITKRVTFFCMLHFCFLQASF